MAALSYDSVEVLKNFAGRRQIGFPLLSDPDSKMIRELGILNERVPKDNFAYGIPHPVTYVVDASGVVHARYFEEDYRQRVTASDILTRHFGRTPSLAVGESETPRLEMTTSASSQIVRGGHRIALVVELDLKPEHHVYAPGQEDYRGVEWEMTPSAGWTSHEVALPAARRMAVAGIPAPALVYEGKLRLVRDLTIGPERSVRPLVNPAGELVVTGSLRYQACDHRQCFPPETVALKWHLRLEGHDLERAPAELRRKSQP